MELLIVQWSVVHRSARR